MINKILWDLINIGKVASFINSIIIEMEKEKEHDKVVEKVIRRLRKKNCVLKCMRLHAALLPSNGVELREINRLTLNLSTEPSRF